MNLHEKTFRIFHMTTRTLLSRISTALCIIMLGFVFTACEEVIDPDGLPYVERLVVDAMLSPDIPADSIYITRTLPLSAKYDRSKAVLTDVTGYVESEGRQYPLVHVDSSRYAATGLIPESGKRYRLVAQWRGKNIQAETTIPFKPEVDTVILRKGRDRSGSNDWHYDTLTAVVHPRGAEVYAMEARTHYSGSDGFEVIDLDYDDVIARASDVEQDGKVHLIYSSYQIFVVDPMFPRTNQAVVYAFDTPFYDYYFSITDDNDGEGAFSSGTRPIYWNIEGDGIGVFMGRAITVVEI